MYIVAPKENGKPSKGERFFGREGICYRVMDMLDTMDFSQSSAGKQYDEVHLGSETLLENTRLGSSLVTCDTEIEADLDKQRFIEIVMWIRDDKKEKISNKQLKNKFEMGYDRANRFLQMLEDAGIISGQKKETKLPRTVNQDKLVLYPVSFWTKDG